MTLLGTGSEARVVECPDNAYILDAAGACFAAARGARWVQGPRPTCTTHASLPLMSAPRRLTPAEAAGLDLPATCRGGICGACVARVRTGTIDASDIADLDFTVSPVSRLERAAGTAHLVAPGATQGGLTVARADTARDGTRAQDEQAQGMALLCMTRATSDLEIETQCDWGYSLGVGEWQGASGRFSAKPDPLMGKEWTDIAKEAEAAKSK